ncbi:MAG: branched-chain amino acid transport system II carrier protein [Dysosmobacter welbionis]
MFFGAGNVIFPPYLGLESGPEWLAGFFSYFMADIGLALLAMFAILRQGSPDGITARIGRIPPQRSCAPLCCASVPCWPFLGLPPPPTKPLWPRWCPASVRRSSPSSSFC